MVLVVVEFAYFFVEEVCHVAPVQHQLLYQPAYHRIGLIIIFITIYATPYAPTLITEKGRLSRNGGKGCP
jgi:hypothetical protein